MDKIYKGLTVKSFSCATKALFCPGSDMPDLTNEPIPQSSMVLLAWFVCQKHYFERLETFAFHFVFVLAHNKPMRQFITSFLSEIAD